MAMMRQALGKGISALIPPPPARPGNELAHEGSSRPSAGTVVQFVGVEAISVNPRQPRTHFDEDAMGELARSVAEQGILQPLLVREVGAGRFELIAGERRLRAARLAELEQVPVLVRQAQDNESLLLAIVENVQRADLSPLEEAQAYQSLIDEFDLTQDEVARRVGKSRPAIANTVRLLQLPEEVRREMAAGTISAGHARALLALDEGSQQTTLAREVVARRLSVRDTEREAARIRQRGASPVGLDPDLKRVERDLGRILGTKVTIHPSRAGSGSGHIAIDYYSDDDLARLVDLLGGGRRRTVQSVRP